MSSNGKNNGKSPEKQVDKPFDKRSVTWFKPGNSGNPAGRPKNKTPSETLHAFATAEYGKYGPEQLKQLQQRMPEPWHSMPIEKITIMEFVAFIQLMQALRPAGWRDRQEFYDRVEGKPVQKVETVKEQEAPARYDWRKLSNEDLLKLRELQIKALVKKEDGE